MSRIDSHGFGLWWRLAQMWLSGQFNAIRTAVSNIHIEQQEEEYATDAEIYAMFPGSVDDNGNIVAEWGIGENGNITADFSVDNGIITFN